MVSYGMNPVDLFEANDLFESGNLTQVQVSLLALAGKVRPREGQQSAQSNTASQAGIFRCCSFIPSQRFLSTHEAPGTLDPRVTKADTVNPFMGRQRTNLHFFIYKKFYVRAFLGSQQNRVEGTETSRLPPAPTHAHLPPLYINSEPPWTSR